VGNAKRGFQRLLNAVESLAADGIFNEKKVFIQSGHNPAFHPRFCEHKPFISMDEFDHWMEKAELIICHGGCTQLTAIRLGKVPVVMPRLEKYDEHINDHQVQLVRALAAEGRIVPAYEPEEFERAISEAWKRNAHPIPPPTSPMLSLLAQAITELSRQRA